MNIKIEMRAAMTTVAFLLGCCLATAQKQDDLFGDAAPAPTTGVAPTTKTPADTTAKVSGNLETLMARMTDDPAHWSNLRLRANIGAVGAVDEIKWKVGLRGDLDGAYWKNNDNIYPQAVRDDQKAELELRENYVDLSSGEWDLRAGKQHVIWGEMVGLFVADVISPRDLRDYLSTDLDPIRRTQWAARLENFTGDWHNEIVWIPVQTYDDIGQPGADYYPMLASGVGYAVDAERRPSRTLANGSFGLRTSLLRNGWDMSAFAYASRNSTLR